MEWNNLLSTLSIQERIMFDKALSDLNRIPDRGTNNYDLRFNNRFLSGHGGGMIDPHGDWDIVKAMNLPIIMNTTTPLAIVLREDVWRNGTPDELRLFGTGNTFPSPVRYTETKETIVVGYYKVNSDVRSIFEEDLPALDTKLSGSTYPPNDISFENLKTLELGLKMDRYQRIKAYIRRFPEEYNRYDICILSNKSMTFDLWRKINAALPALCPKFFSHLQKTQKDIDVIDFYRTLAEPTADKTLEFIKKFLSDTSAYAAMRHQQIESSLSRTSQRQINTLENDIRHRQEEVSGYEREVCLLHNKILEYQQRLVGIQHTQETFKEDIDYLLNKDNLLSIEVGASEDVSFIMHIYSRVFNYDADILETYLKSHNSIFWKEERAIESENGKMPTEIFENYFKNNPKTFSMELREIFKRIFLDCTLNLIFENKIKIFSNGEPRVYLPGADFKTLYKGCVNPHLQFFNCFGSNKSIITKAFLKNDFIMLLEQCQASIGGLNFADGAVMGEWIPRLLRQEPKFWEQLCIEDAEGNRYSFKTLAEQIRKEWNDNESNQNAGEPESDSNGEISGDAPIRPVG